MSNRGPVGIALIGAGNISGQYLETLGAFPDVRLTAIADLDVELARGAPAGTTSPRPATPPPSWPSQKSSSS